MKNCNICSSGNFKQIPGNFTDYISGEDFKLIKCTHCGSLKTTGSFQSENYYGSRYYGSEAGKFSLLIERLFQYNHKRNAFKFFNINKPRTVLEIGCGRGYILKELKNLGSNVKGLESKDASNWILHNPDIDVIAVDDSYNWPIESNSQDLIIIWHVLEHLTEPDKALKEIYRVLSPNGVLCISIPNASSFQFSIGLGKWFHLDVPRHLYHFTEPGIIKLVQNCDLQLTKRESGEITQNLYGWIQTICNRITPNNINLLYRFIQGGTPWKSAKKKHQIVIHAAFMPIILILSCFGLIYEKLTQREGCVTYYYKKSI